MTRYDARQVADKLGKSENWVKRNAHRLPHSRAGKTYFWTDEDLRALFAFLSHRPTQETDGLRPLTGRRAS